ncbi:Ras-related protein RABH1b [Tritrichomonas foetus]|uniref:Ras-related protein RABH1b n=1 Tax=Tritrichomonas foetus TaxID=1144522 RepID=A0A1J4K4F2_9EUKA|nr:Ras-related protein RABH1b [Tritrichomonas foetus]|eukprot:OHT04636.1 Ras-related protein RABH1b [Tritrichomonas foetus]
MERHKVIFVGDTGVGKTSIIRRKKEGLFDYKMLPTVGAAHELISEFVDDHEIELCLWDTAGQEQFKSLIPVYFRGAHVAVIVASYADPLSITNLKKWREKCDETQNPPTIIIVINKIDIQEGNFLSLDELRGQLQQEYPSFFFVSAKNGDGIDMLFFEIAKAALAYQDTFGLNEKDVKNIGGGAANCATSGKKSECC